MDSIMITAEERMAELSGPGQYLIGAVLAIAILGYLVYALIRPEKF